MHYCVTVWSYSRADHLSPVDIRTSRGTWCDTGYHYSDNPFKNNLNTFNFRAGAAVVWQYIIGDSSTVLSSSTVQQYILIMSYSTHTHILVHC